MKYCLILILLGLTSLPSIAAESIVVVTNSENKALKLSHQEIRNLFMGGAISADLKAVALPAENRTRVLFNTKVVGLTESRIQSYWAQMRFSGRKKPPLELSNEAMVLQYLKDNPNSVGYLPDDAILPDGLTVIFQSQ